MYFFFFSSRRRHTSSTRDWSSDVCSSDLDRRAGVATEHRWRWRRTAIDLPLQHVEVALQAVEALLRRAILGPGRRRRDGQRDAERHTQKRTRQERSPEHSWTPRTPAGAAWPGGGREDSAP